MNILAINWRCIKNPEMGGAEVHFHEIFKRIVKKGHQVTLVAHHFDNAPKEEIIDGIKIIRTGNKFFFDRQFKNYYLKNLQKNNYDLVVDDISKIPLNTPKYINTPIVGILHHIHGNSIYKEVFSLLAYYIIKKEKSIPKYYKNSPIFIVSESSQNELVKLGMDKSKTDILYNAIDQSLFSNVNVKKAESPTITYVGRIKNYKNINVIIDAVSIVAKRIPNIKFIIGGKGDNLENLKQQTEKLNLVKNVEFTGFLSEQNKAELLSKSWLFVTMAEKEGWGITVIEANAVKTPAIGSNVPGLRDSIRNGETGFLVELGNKNELANKIISLLENNDELNRISENAYKWSKKFSWNNSADYFLTKIVDWYPELKSKI